MKSYLRILWIGILLLNSSLSWGAANDPDPFSDSVVKRKLNPLKLMQKTPVTSIKFNFLNVLSPAVFHNILNFLPESDVSRFSLLNKKAKAISQSFLSKKEKDIT